MHVRGDMYGNYRECLQCGFMADLEEESRYKNRPVPAKATQKAARKPGKKRTAA